MSEAALDVLHDLRRRRKRHRLGDIEWFDAAYRVYLVALFGGGTVLWISSSISDADASAPSRSPTSPRTGPALIGMITALAFLAALRSGAQGGPLALEAADVAYVMLSPVDRMRALLRPVTPARPQRGLARPRRSAPSSVSWPARRLPGTPIAWAASGAAVRHLHARSCGPGPRWLPTPFACRCGSRRRSGSAIVAWQGAAVAWHIPGPGQHRRQPGDVGLAPAPDRPRRSPSSR